MFEVAPVARDIVTVIGAVTALFAATVGLAQNDIKRVIAYSTCSQLGYMFFAAGVGAYQAAMFHLFTHAFFKALLFLGAGSVIHGMHHEQDMRRMGGLRSYLPVTYAVMTIGTLAITGFGIPSLCTLASPASIRRTPSSRRPSPLPTPMAGWPPSPSRRPHGCGPDRLLFLAPGLHDLPRDPEVGRGGRAWPR
jgi:hypothetical protein